MNYNVLKDSIAAVIKANGNEEITGDLLKQVLLSMVNILGSGYQFMGAAVPTTNPGTPDARVFYIATQAGTYANFGSPAIVLDGTQIAVLLFASSWTSVVLSVPTKEYVDTALASKVDKVEGKGLSTNDLTNALVTLIGGAFQKEDIAQDLGDSTTKVVSQAAITAVLLQYAKVDGYYSQLTAGAAENLVGRGSVPASFLRRTTGGTADVGTGSAKIAKLMGNSIVWNQIVPIPSSDTSKTESDVTITDNRDGSYSISTEEGGASANVYGSNLLLYSAFVSGHKYLVTGLANDISLQFNVSGTVIDNNTIFVYDSPAQGNCRLYIASGTITIGVKVYPNIFDLTKMFGAGKEPTTAAEFEALYPLDYYANNAGEVLPFAAEKLVTTGFNQWDEEWELGYWDSTGWHANNNFLGSKNYIVVFPSTSYFFKSPTNVREVQFWDANKNYINRQTWNEGAANSDFTTPANCYYITFYFGGSYGTTYNNDICINLSWSGYRNGEYEPYEKHELVVDPANWEDANGNKIFPYGGMHGGGTAMDFATPDNDGFIRKGTRVFGRVDLGSLEWSYEDGRFLSAATVTDIKTHSSSVLPNAICGKYVASTYNGLSDKTFAAGDNGGNPYRIYINDSAYTDAATFKTAMNGVYLYYELATPVETELAEPVATSYYANDFGTEEWTPANTDEPYTSPCELAIAYAMNAVDTLRRLPENYISTGSFENFCTELATKLGAALNKTITITPTYDSEDAEYDYAITIADIEE